VPIVRINDIVSVVPYDCVPMAVDLVDDAHSLPGFVHPERDFYVFGPEDGTLGRKHLDRCEIRLRVPTRFCMNLAPTGHVILYDRLAKQFRKEWAA
jgi:tRNA(Leu) C34 or U34 (ribose-2'-O)-methylase TrmL